LIRWALMLDHWYQHNIEYLNGTMALRGMPDIRVGYRLDVYERRESYYVEGVTNNWEFPGPLTTTLAVSRGQRNDPLPVYEKPALPAFGAPPKSGRREDSRLALFFKQADPSAVLRALTKDGTAIYEEVLVDQDSNFIDMPAFNVWGTRATFIQAGAGEWLTAQQERDYHSAQNDKATAAFLQKQAVQGDAYLPASQKTMQDFLTKLQQKQAQLNSPFLESDFSTKGSGGTGKSQ